MPTVRPSASIEVFEMTAREAIERLDALRVSGEANELRREALALLALFRSWSVRAPSPEDRAASITRLMSMHRAVEEYVARHR